MLVYCQYYSSTRTTCSKLIRQPLYVMVALEGLTQDLNIDVKFHVKFHDFPPSCEISCLRLHPFAKLDVKFYVYDFTRWPRRDTKDLNIDVKFHGKTFTTFPQVFHVCVFSPVAKFYVKFHVCDFPSVAKFDVKINFMSATFPRSQNLPWIFFQ